MSEILKGIGVTAGTAIGRIKVVSNDLSVHLQRYLAEIPEKEAEKFLSALIEAKRQVVNIIENAETSVESSRQAAIMEAHLVMLEDTVLKAAILQKIENSMPAPKAVLESIQEYADILVGMEDTYFQERSADVLDIGRRIAKILLGVAEFEWGREPIVLCGNDVEPSLLADISSDIVKGLVLAKGSTTSHSAIIAKARGIIAVVGTAGVEFLQDGTHVVVDGTAGEVIVSPEPSELAVYLTRIQEEQDRRLDDQAKAVLPAVTVDGKRVQLAANIASPQDLGRALQLGCEGVGLFRTEFLFMKKSAFPTEEEQYEAYRSAAQQCGEHLCVIRTLDIGGDKPLSYMKISQESNPFLGWRSIRICLDHPDLFVTQLKAILRAGIYGNVAIMLPMVTLVDEIRQSKKCLIQAMSELEQEGKNFARNVPLGIMIETPAAAVTAERLAKECDFFSIGTNDLTQYTLAVDRGNPKVARLYNPLHPAVLQLIKNIIYAAHSHGIWVGVCGEMAGDPLAAILLVGMGVDELSMDATAMPAVREQIRSLSVLEMRDIMQKALLMDDGEEN